MNMPDKISISPQGGFDPVTGNARTGYRFCIGVNATQYTRTDLSQSLADALEDVLNAGRGSSGRIILDIEQEESVRAALANYRKGESV